MSDSRGRSTRRYRELSAEVHARRKPCIICGQPIDYRLPYLNPLTGLPDPRSKSIQHLKSVHRHPELAEDITNMASAHLGCNQKVGDDPVVDLEPPTTTRDW